MRKRPHAPRGYGSKIRSLVFGSFFGVVDWHAWPARSTENRFDLDHESFIALALLAATSLVAGFFAYIYSLKRQMYLLLWTGGLDSVRSALPGSRTLPMDSGSDRSDRPGSLALCTGGVVFLFGRATLRAAQALDCARARSRLAFWVLGGGERTPSF